MSKYCSNCGYKFEEWDGKSCPLCYSTKWSYRKEYTHNSSGNGKKIGIGAGLGLAVILFVIIFQVDFDISTSLDDQAVDGVIYTGCTMNTDGTNSAYVKCDGIDMLSLVRDLPLKEAKVDDVTLTKKSNFYKVEFETPLGIPIAYMLTNPNFAEQFSVELDVELKEVEIPEIELEALIADIPDIEFEKFIPTHSYDILDDETIYAEWTEFNDPDSFTNPFQDDNTYQISYETIPSFANRNVVQAGLNKAISMWENSNPDLEFEIVDGNSDIHIKWHRDLGPDMQGYQHGSILVIELGSFDCNSNWNIYSQNEIADSIAHETGHYLGLEHHMDERHLMYGIDEFTQRNFNDLGYNIPSRNNMYIEWEATIELERELDKLEQQLSKLPRVANNEYIYRQAMQLNNQYNNIVNQYNNIADQYDCFLG